MVEYKVTFIFQARGKLKLVQAAFEDAEIKSRGDLEKRIEKAHEIAEHQFKRVDKTAIVASMHNITLWKRNKNFGNWISFETGGVHDES